MNVFGAVCSCDPVVKVLCAWGGGGGLECGPLQCTPLSSLAGSTFSHPQTIKSSPPQMMWGLWESGTTGAPAVQHVTGAGGLRDHPPIASLEGTRCRMRIWHHSNSDPPPSHTLVATTLFPPPTAKFPHPQSSPPTTPPSMPPRVSPSSYSTPPPKIVSTDAEPAPPNKKHGKERGVGKSELGDTWLQQNRKQSCRTTAMSQCARNYRSVVK